MGSTRIADRALLREVLRKISHRARTSYTGSVPGAENRAALSKFIDEADLDAIVLATRDLHGIRNIHVHSLGTQVTFWLY